MGSHEELRRFYARLVTSTVRAPEPRLVEAFATVPRERYVGPGPWTIPVFGGYMNSDTDDPAILYQDINIALVPSLGINNGQPTLHAKCLAAAAPNAGDTVVHVGAGTGYYTAILAQLAGHAGRVLAYEVNQELAGRASANLQGYSHVQVVATSALESVLPPADVIYVSAGTTEMPAVWLDALSVGGRLVLPLTPTTGPGFMLMVTRLTTDAYQAQYLSPAFFIPCSGARTEEQSAALAAARVAQSPEMIRSLHRGTAPDATAWCTWADSWLSTAAVEVR